MAIQGLLCLHTNFETFCSGSVKNVGLSIWPLLY